MFFACSPQLPCHGVVMPGSSRGAILCAEKDMFRSAAFSAERIVERLDAASDAVDFGAGGHGETLLTTGALGRADRGLEESLIGCQPIRFE